MCFVAERTIQNYDCEGNFNKGIFPNSGHHIPGPILALRTGPASDITGTEP
jgi:hypothetical protein